jgi:hypothetical protein
VIGYGGCAGRGRGAAAKPSISHGGGYNYLSILAHYGNSFLR